MEEFRLVKRTLLRNMNGSAQQPAIARGERILVTSANPNEGKTFCSVNLALSMAAEADHEVLLVDADFAKPSVLSTLGLTDEDIAHTVDVAEDAFNTLRKNHPELA